VLLRNQKNGLIHDYAVVYRLLWMILPTAFSMFWIVGRICEIFPDISKFIGNDGERVTPLKWYMLVLVGGLVFGVVFQILSKIMGLR